MTHAAHMTAQKTTPSTRIETDSFDEIEVPAEAYWGAKTQRSMQNFDIGTEKMPARVVRALGVQKKAAALTNMALNVLDAKLGQAIVQAADEIMDGTLAGQFPLSVWQTGSGTQTNMNANEVIAGRANEILGNRDAQRDDLTTLHTLAERLGDAHRRAETILAQARYHWQTGDYAQTLETASRGLALTDVPPETQAALLEILGQATRDQGDYPQARAWFEQALSLHQTIGNLSCEASGLDLLGIVAQRQGNLP